ncbi:carbohydrate ABC transporter membrane protein 2, CUT1 family (TC 3.A.1.1.-) [Streptoalloteichus tenebrarius]|uniref:Carbohydrate ABC transporter membrane protein 2, CUT1 family (TC 3.A.1.1.-) n=1 Tax=Streptoalloteichus tenebrarius (strain ATCC 17920 / DSM 40477 / JCM 4838 / CBS 697.72 / NBRC 16177 / NCIMB 11028 / NRRL B-12390 / A12253. 1 / ISP 5477) TaxID=1933 RepID=A0ABT1HU70_STRSD|nr:carbohydrate ABC transporter permease [Streptoalloteichus tenebrarius]MCP2259067.1 carbohydrate ABC transporter membrane protein 2, CUT1 family (TC 3.A.1.1.-) [Streptoalloteichus tenebrarius]BFE99607.1 carbohydrate ABC transporter permease [Streptoalloteichus tenebrarius]
MRISRTERVGTYLVLLVFTASALFPVLSIVATALRPEVVGQGGWRPENLVTAWTVGHFGGYLRNSAIVSAVVVAVSAVLSVLAGYAFGAMRFRGRGVLFSLLLLGMMVPTEALVVPLYFDLRDLGLTDTYLSLVLPQVAQSVAFGAFWMRAFFLSHTRDLVEAARMDGAGHVRTLWSVLLPLARPAVVTLVVLVFLWTWNEFMLALVMVTDEGLRTAPLGLRFFAGRATTSVPVLAAGSMLVALPVVLLYLFLQRHFIRGMLDGAVKG